MRWRICVVFLMGASIAAGCTKGKSTDLLIGDLNSKDEGDRVKAVRLLPQRKGDAVKVVPALIDSLSDKDVRVRISAAIGLGNFGAQAKTALPDLEKAQSDQDARVREAARVAISRIGPLDKREEKENASKS